MPEITMTNSEALKFWRSRAGLAQRSAADIHNISVEVLIAIEQGKVSVDEKTFDAMIEAYRQTWRKANSTTATVTA